MTSRGRVEIPSQVDRRTAPVVMREGKGEPVGRVGEVMFDASRASGDPGKGHVVEPGGAVSVGQAERHANRIGLSGGRARNGQALPVVRPFDRRGAVFREPPAVSLPGEHHRGAPGDVLGLHPRLESVRLSGDDREGDRRPADRTLFPVARAGSPGVVEPQASFSAATDRAVPGGRTSRLEGAGTPAVRLPIPIRVLFERRTEEDVVVVFQIAVRLALSGLADGTRCENHHDLNVAHGSRDRLHFRLHFRFHFAVYLRRPV